MYKCSNVQGRSAAWTQHECVPLVPLRERVLWLVPENESYPPPSATKRSKTVLANPRLCSVVLLRILLNNTTWCIPIGVT